MANNILTDETYTLKLTKYDRKNLVRFCMITPPIIDTISTLMEQMKGMESYLAEWQELETPISKIIKKME